MEPFSDGALLFLSRRMKLLDMSLTAWEMLRRMDGKTPVKMIAETLAAEFQVDFDVVFSDIIELIEEMKNKEVLIEMQGNGKVDAMNDEDKYVINPDVSCRVEGDEGAILFNPDSNMLQVINPTGLLIWECLEKPRTKRQVVEELFARCEDVPESQVEADVEEFIAILETKGFLGKVIEDAM